MGPKIFVFKYTVLGGVLLSVMVAFFGLSDFETVFSQSFSQSIEAQSQRMPSSIERGLAAIAKPSRHFGEGRFVPAPARAFIPEPKSAFADPSAYIPLDLTPTRDLDPTEKSQHVMTKVADHSLSTLFNSPEFRGSALGQAATEVEKTVKQEVVIKASGPEAREHKFNFNIQAFQTTARVEYQGIARVELIYNLRFSTMDLEVSEKLSERQKISVVHSEGPAKKESQLRMSWSF